MSNQFRVMEFSKDFLLSIENPGSLIRYELKNGREAISKLTPFPIVTRIGWDPDREVVIVRLDDDNECDTNSVEEVAIESVLYWLQPEGESP